MAIIKTGVGTSIKKDLLSAVQEAVQQAKMKLREDRIDLALFFTSRYEVNSGLLKSLSMFLGGAPVIGASSQVIISDQGIFSEGMTIMLLHFGKDAYFNTACVTDILDKSAIGLGQELGYKILSGMQNIHRDISIIFSDNLAKEGAELILGLQQKLGSSFPLIGASLSDIMGTNRTTFYYNQNLLHHAAMGILFGGKIGFGLGVKHGWQPLGKPRSVSKSSGNTIFEIDGLPAAQLYEEYFGFNASKLKNELHRISLFYPIGIYVEGEEEYLLRNILKVEDDGSLTFHGDVPQGSSVRLMIGTKESCLDAAKDAIFEAKEGLFGRPPAFMLIFNSISRYSLLGRDAYKELEIIKNNLDKDTSIIGLYTYGEQAPLLALNYRGKAYFHNQTITALAIGG